MASETLERLHAATKRRGQGYDRALAARRAYADYAASVTARLLFRRFAAYQREQGVRGGQTGDEVGF